MCNAPKLPNYMDSCDLLLMIRIKIFCRVPVCFVITKTHNLVGKKGRGGKAESLSEGESDHNIHLSHKHNVVFLFFLN